jgi:hypothetical protein
MTLSDQLNALVDEHKLTGLNVGILIVEASGRRFWSANAYANPRLCTGGHGDTPEAAIGKAIAEINHRRAESMPIQQLEAA